jgi:hypothetical protein
MNDGQLLRSGGKRGTSLGAGLGISEVVCLGVKVRHWGPDKHTHCPGNLDLIRETRRGFK